jgi:hypothetical protein
MAKKPDGKPALLTFSLAAGVMAARTTAAFMRWAVQRTLAVEW